ncbi:hypothetical protein HDU98_005163 [Podochytrium sp. JEL0797]|nr:hypothetical protein HDU98_005163 [Podochytrium sp. JEL0797]
MPMTTVTKLTSPPLTPPKCTATKRPIDQAAPTGFEDPFYKRIKVESPKPEALLAAAFNTMSEDTTRFDSIIRLLAPPKGKAAPCLTPDELYQWVAALSHYVSKMQASAASLIDAILSIDWVSRDDKFVAEYRHLLENLVSANASFVQPVLRMLISSFRAVPLKNASPAHLSVKFDHIHTILGGILCLIPSAPSLLTHIVSENFPHKSENVEENMWFLKNIMRIVSYAPVLQNAIWLLAIDRIVQIDVGCSAFFSFCPK